MSITKAEVLVAVNKRLIRAETDIDVELRQALKHISGAGKFLPDSTTDTIADGDTEMDYPTDCSVLKAIFIDDSEVPLDRMSYPRNDEGELEVGEPTAYEEFDGKIRFDKEVDADYDVRIDYWKWHPESLTTILFGDEFREAIYSLTTALVAYAYGIVDRGQFWEGRYYQELDMLRSRSERKGPRFVRYNQY